MNDTPHSGAPATEALSAIDQTAQRAHKYAEYLRRGGVRYPNSSHEQATGAPIAPNTTSAELATRYAEMDKEALIATPTPTYVLSGRIMALRLFGKLLFAQLQDNTGRLQLAVSLDGSSPEVFALFNDCIDLGDWVSVSGPLFRTNKGELTLQVQNFTLLAKCNHPLPDKWHGLEDIEQRYRQRYLDFIVNPEVKQVFTIRSKMVSAIRRFLDDNGFMEVETPVLQLQAGGALARPFHTHHNALDLALNLRIAPELFLKRLLVGGFPRVFELSRNFRNEGISTKHNPEFTMLEWYMAYATREDGMALMEQMLRHVVMSIFGHAQIPYGAHMVDFSKPFARMTMRESLLNLAGFTEADLEHMDALVAAAKAKKVEVPSPLPSYGELFQHCFETLVEPQLIQPTYIMDYPIETSPLTRQDPNRPGWTQRAELYIVAREHGEFYSELNDPEDQRQRFEAQREKAKKGDGEAMPFDHDFLNALELGMPPANGIGLGIDRLAMLLANQPSIRDVSLFPLLRPKG
jgi:lysyl-tRNA synthetase class 2